MAKAKPTTSPKSDQQEGNRCQVEDLSVNLAAVLNHKACPEQLHSAIVDCLSEMQSRNDCYNVDFLLGLLLSKPHQGGRRCPVKTATAKKPNQELQKEKVDLIPARLAWDHVDRLDGLNQSFSA